MASSRSRTLDAVGISPDIVLGDVDGNVARLSDALERYDDDTTRLIVAPELATSGYVFADRAEALPLGIGCDDARLKRLARRLGPRSVAVVGIAERDGDVLFNTAVVLSRDGVTASYRKSHLWGAEKLIFESGERAGMVVETAVGRLAVAICYDNEFPEVPRALALAGADILALPVNWPRVPRPAGERPPETIQAMAAARSSRLPTVIADRFGTERGVEWTGGTTVIDGEGWIVAEEHDGVAAATVVIEPGEKGLGPHNDLFADRRPDLYLGPAS